MIASFVPRGHFLFGVNHVLHWRRDGPFGASFQCRSEDVLNAIVEDAYLCLPFCLPSLGQMGFVKNVTYMFRDIVIAYK